MGGYLPIAEEVTDLTLFFGHTTVCYPFLRQSGAAPWLDAAPLGGLWAILVNLRRRVRAPVLRGPNPFRIAAAGVTRRRPRFLRPQRVLEVAAVECLGKQAAKDLAAVQAVVLKLVRNPGVAVAHA